jgi:hypothetical protein
VTLLAQPYLAISCLSSVPKTRPRATWGHATATEQLGCGAHIIYGVTDSRGSPRIIGRAFGAKRLGLCQLCG